MLAVRPREAGLSPPLAPRLPGTQPHRKYGVPLADNKEEGMPQIFTCAPLTGLEERGAADAQ